MLKLLYAALPFMLLSSSSSGAEGLRLTIIYDNNPFREGLETAWGFSCLIEGLEKTILFDTGGDGRVLLSNMEKLKIDPGKVDIVFLSHEHWDHVGGLSDFLSKNPNVTVYMLKSFTGDQKSQVRTSGAKLVEVTEPVEICKNVFSTGELGTSIKEESLFIKSKQGYIVITGCAHPGIVNMIRKSREISGGDIYLAIGGFHLVNTAPEDIRSIAKELKDQGVRKTAACHCSGDDARNIFSEIYGKNFISVGVGSVIEAEAASDKSASMNTSWSRLKRR